MNVLDLYEVQIPGLLHNQATINVLHYTIEGTVGELDVEQAFADRMEALITPRWVSLCSTEWVGGCVGIQRLLPTLGLTYCSTDEIGAGSASGQPLPTYVAGVVSKYSDIATRSGRGRLFLPGLSESDVQNDRILDTPFVALEDLADMLKATVDTFSAEDALVARPVVFSRRRAQLELDPDRYIITQTKARRFVGTMRSRKVREYGA